jgi:ubiquinone/menaquinone biosynthesis C-methylase UbiE
MSSPQEYLTFQPALDSQEVVSAYDELPLWSAAFGLLLLRNVPLRAGITALDVGCGTGFPLLELAQRLGPSATVHGIDPWETALARARYKARNWNVRNVTLTHGDAAALPFADAHFDLIVSNLGVNNFEDPDAVLRELRRVCAPGGTLTMTSNLRGHMREFYDVYAATLREMGNVGGLEALTRHIEHRVTLDELRSRYERAGFRVTRVEQGELRMRFADGSALLRHAFIKLGFLEEWKNVVDASEQEATFARLEARLNELAAALGDLTLTIPMAYVEGEKAYRSPTERATSTR